MNRSNISHEGPIRDGDDVYIRGTRGDPHFQIEKNGKVRAIGGPPSATILAIHNLSRKPGSMLRYGDPVLIRGLDKDPHFQLEKNGNVRASGGPPTATTLIIEPI